MAIAGGRSFLAVHLSSRVVEGTVNRVDFVNIANILARLLETDHFEKEVWVITCQPLPDDCIAWPGIVSGQRSVYISVERISVIGEIVSAQVDADNRTV